VTNSVLKVEQRGAVRLLTIDDPPWNVMSVAFMNELEREVAAVAADDATRAVVITGAGDANFSAGMNLKELVPILGDQAAFDELLDQRLRVLSAIENMAKPWVATLFGHCLGGGLELPLACHFRIAADEGAKIGLPEMDLGTVPAWGGSARLTRCVGRDHALDMILRGLKITGPRAEEIGLVTEVVPLIGLKARALELAQELAAMPRLAVKSMMECIVQSELKTLEQSLSDERAAVRATFGSADAVEGFQAFLQKRKPVFNQ
jgi:enoyl-CoA hydratase/carnithine racemase